MLRQLAAYHQRDPLTLMLVRIAQGMVQMGKGTVTLNPFHSNRQLMSPSAVAGLFATCFTFLDVKNSKCFSFFFVISYNFRFQPSWPSSIICFTCSFRPFNRAF